MTMTDRCPILRRMRSGLATVAAVLIGSSCVQGLEPASKNLEQAAEAVAKGLDSVRKFDPVGYNKLLTKNDALADDLLVVQKQLDETAGPGGTLVAEKDVIDFQVPDYVGSFIVDAVLDGKTHFWHTEYPLRGGDDLTPKFQQLAAGFIDAEQKASPVCAGGILEMPMQAAGLAAMGCMFKQIQQNLGGLVNPTTQTCTDYIKNSALVPAGELIPAELQVNGLSPGKHVVSFTVTPMQPGSANHWAARVQISVRHPNGAIGTPANYDELDAEHAGAVMGKPLQSQYFVLFVGKAT